MEPLQKEGKKPLADEAINGRKSWRRVSIIKLQTRKSSKLNEPINYEPQRPIKSKQNHFFFPLLTKKKKKWENEK